MTIHHDKLAYGKLASSSEELSEDKIAEMLARLAQKDDEETEKESENSAEKKQGK